MNYSKKIFFFLLLSSLAFCIFAQSNQLSNSNSDSNENSAAQVSPSENQSFTFDVNANAGTSANSPRARSTVWIFVRMIIVLALVVAAIYALMRFFKKGSGAAVSDDRFLSRVSTLSLGPGKSVEVVALVDRAYILGVTDENINLISEVEDKELVQAMTLYASKNQPKPKPKSFAEVLEIFMPNNQKNNSENVFESTSSPGDIINRQRQKLEGGEE